MASYYFCPGIAEASAFAVQCSEAMQSYQPPVEQTVLLSELVAQGIFWGLTYASIFFIFSQIKKAIEAD
ncbi:hypothetical protein [Pseudomonas sp.]|jgi:hypothetical protein|uniref:hypothetical protein n=1 Tax=Pseudomonas sp. TaxID=306 RepID=UPI0037CCA0FD